MARIALVTGGIGGIGTAICTRLAKDGCTVVANHHPSEADAAEAWKKERAAEGFTIDDHCRRRVLLRRQRAHGQGDHRASTARSTSSSTVPASPATRPSRRWKPAHWNAVINVNLNSVFNVTRQVWEGMLERGYGRIINISSVNGQRGQFGQANYSAAKAGMHGFTMALAQEGASKGVTVNTVSPGYVETAMTLAMDDIVRNSIIGGIPMRRMAQPAEIAAAIAFLASDESAYVTGANLPVNGGLFMH